MMSKWYLPRFIDEYRVMKYLLDHIDTDGGYFSNYFFRAGDMKWCDPDSITGLIGFDTDGLMALKVRDLASVITKLIIGGFIEQPRMVAGYDDLVEIPITHQGRLYFINKRKYILKTIICSVVLPIIVAYITTLLTVCH